VLCPREPQLPPDGRLHTAPFKHLAFNLGCGDRFVTHDVHNEVVAVFIVQMADDATQQNAGELVALRDE